MATSHGKTSQLALQMLVLLLAVEKTGSMYVLTVLTDRKLSTGDTLIFDSSVDSYSIKTRVIEQKSNTLDSVNQQLRENFFYDINTWVPSLTISNTSWGKTWQFPPPEYPTADWTMEIRRSMFTSDLEASNVKQVWRMTIRLTVARTELKSENYLSDTFTEPWLRRELGVPFNAASLPVAPFTVASSPCNPLLKIAMLQPERPVTELVFAVTVNYFATLPPWYKRDASTMCSVDQNCASFQLRSLEFTNFRLIVISNLGVHVSDDIRHAPASDILSFILYENLFVSSCPAGQELVTNLGYTDQCVHCSRTARHDDFLTLTSYCKGGQSPGTSYFSSGNFSNWISLYTLYNDPAIQIIDATIHLHMFAMIILTRANNSFGVETRRFQKNDMPSGKLLHRKYNFPSNVTFIRIFVHPWTHFVYAYDVLLFLSDNVGYEFEEVFPLLLDPIRAPPVINWVRHTYQTASAQIVLEGGNRAALVTAGMPRFVYVVNQASSFQIDHEGTVKPLHLWPGGLIRFNNFNVTFFLSNLKYPGIYPLAIIPFGDTHAFLFEFPETVDNEQRTPFFTRANVGQQLMLPARNSRPQTILGIIEDVVYPRENSVVLSKILIELTSPVPREPVASRPELLGSLEVIYQTKVQVKLALIGTGTTQFLSGDTFYTVVVPGVNSFLIIEGVGDTNGFACVPGKPGDRFTFGKNKWYLSGLGKTERTTGWVVVERLCPLEIQTDQLPEVLLDLHESAVVNFKSAALIKTVLNTQQAPFSVTFSNSFAFEFTKDAVNSARDYTASVTLSAHRNKRAATAVIARSRRPSMSCRLGVRVVTVRVGCPCTKRLQFAYPIHIPKDVFLNGDPKDNSGLRLVVNLPPNYRPPSKFGRDVPTSPNVYNADPARGFRNSLYNISRSTWRYQQCAGKATQAECGCTEEERYRASTDTTDCRQRVYVVRYIARVQVNLALIEVDRPDEKLTGRHLITIDEVNDRDYDVIAPCTGPICSLATNYNQEQVIRGVNNTVYYPPAVWLYLNGSELYHFRATMVSGLSFCDDLAVDFQLYVDDAPLAYPLVHIVHFTVAVILGGAFFITYLYYLSNLHTWRVRSTGPLCPDKHTIDQAMATFPPGQVVPKSAAGAAKPKSPTALPAKPAANTKHNKTNNAVLRRESRSHGRRRSEHARENSPVIPTQGDQHNDLVQNVGDMRALLITEGLGRKNDKAGGSETTHLPMKESN